MRTIIEIMLTWLCTTCRLQYLSAERHCDADWLSPSKNDGLQVRGKFNADCLEHHSTLDLQLYDKRILHQIHVFLFCFHLLVFHRHHDRFQLMTQERISQEQTKTQTLIKQPQLVAEKIFWFSTLEVLTLTKKERRNNAKKTSNTWTITRSWNLVST